MSENEDLRAQMSDPRAMLRVCPMRDAICPHGMSCPYTDGYNCKPGWNALSPKIQPERATE